MSEQPSDLTRDTSSRRLPPRSERRALLRERGWVRIGSSGSETWQQPRFGLRRFSLAAAYREETSGA